MPETLKPEVARLFRAAKLPRPDSDELIGLLNKLDDDDALMYVLHRCAVRVDALERRISQLIFACDEAIQLLARNALENAVVVLGVAVRSGKEN